MRKTREVPAAADRDVVRALQALKNAKHDANVSGQAGLHPFPARMPVPLAKYLLTALLPAPARVLDPMSGSGSTLVAARLLGHRAAGVDMDPLAVLMARSYTAAYDTSAVDRLGARLLEKAKKIYAAMPRVSVTELLGGGKEERKFIKYWFPTTAQRQLYSLREAIRKEGDGSLRNVGWLVFSSLIISKGASVSYAIDIARSRPHKDDERGASLPFSVWDKRFRQLTKRLPFMGNTAGPEPVISRGDARHLGYASNTVDAVLTSPPYLNAVDYLRGHKFSLLWMGHSLSRLREVRGTMIGTERGLWKPDGLPPSMETSLAAATDDERAQALSRRYLSDLRYSLLEMKRVVRPNGLITLVLGPSVLDKDEADSVDVARALAADVGLEFVVGMLRPLHGDRRSLPPPSSVLKSSELASRMSQEAIVVMRKSS